MQGTSQVAKDTAASKASVVSVFVKLMVLWMLHLKYL